MEDVSHAYLFEHGEEDAWWDALEEPVSFPEPHIPLPQAHDTSVPLPPPPTWEEVLKHLDRWLAGGDQEAPPQVLEAFRDELQRCWGAALQDSHFKAGVPHTRVREWHQYFFWGQHGQPLAPAQARILDWLKEGVRINWVSPFQAQQRKHPRFQERLDQVMRLIRQTFPREPSKVDSLLQGEHPASVHFPNLPSAVKHADFVRASLDDLLRSGAIRSVSHEQVHVVNGLGVVVNRKGKLRLVLNATYINLFDRYEVFTYEKLSDIPQYVKAGMFCLLTDCKSGYHHFLIHPDDQKYLGVEFEGQFYVFNALPFGLSSACRVYTCITQQVFAPLRARGLLMTSYIDDAFYAAPSEAAGLSLACMLLVLFTWLGFCLSRAKCSLVPALQGIFLGLIVDLQRQAFGVPTEKAEYILHLWDSHAAAGLTKRTAAQLAGLLVSISPAVPLAPLYLRRLFQAQGKGTDWDTPLCEEAAVLASEDHAFWQLKLQRPCFKPWRRTGPVYVCTGDASAVGYGGFSPDLLPAPMMESFTLEEVQLMREGTLSSCHREVRNACLLIVTCLKQNPTKLQGATLLFFGDNVAAICNINSLNGKPHTLREIRSMYEEAAKIDVEVRAQWVSRNAPDMQLADHYSRCKDPGDFAVTNSVYVDICRTQRPGGGSWGFCTGDCFAGTVPEFHHSPRYFTRFPAPAGNGADALSLPWSILDPPRIHGVPNPPVQLWVFPPRHLVRQAIDKIALERKDCIFVIANMDPTWRAWLQHLPIVHEMALQRRPGVLVPGSRMPKSMLPSTRQGGRLVYTAFLTCFLIRYVRVPHLARKRQRRR